MFIHNINYQFDVAVTKIIISGQRKLRKGSLDFEMGFVLFVVQCEDLKMFNVMYLIRQQ